MNAFRPSTMYDFTDDEQSTKSGLDDPFTDAVHQVNENSEREWTKMSNDFVNARIPPSITFRPYSDQLVFHRQDIGKESQQEKKRLSRADSTQALLRLAPLSDESWGTCEVSQLGCAHYWSHPDLL